MKWIMAPRYDGRMEWNCEHGVGHGNHVHGCDRCCSLPDYPGVISCPFCGKPMLSQGWMPVYQARDTGIITYRCGNSYCRAVAYRPVDFSTQRAPDIVSKEEHKLTG